MAQPTDKLTTIGVADGVSSWARMGIDSGLFSWELMRCCEEAIAKNAADGPSRALRAGYLDMIRRGRQAPLGSTTACLASLDRLDGEIVVANLGDSGALMARQIGGHGPTAGRFDTVLATKEQVHSFNCPFQLMISPNGASGVSHGDAPSSCDEYRLKAQDGDLIILGTDGLFDNLWRARILEVLAEMRGAPPGKIAERLCRLAYESSVSIGVSVPFSAMAREAGFNHQGGKPDDITVLVARVASRAASE